MVWCVCIHDPKLGWVSQPALPTRLWLSLLLLLLQVRVVILGQDPYINVGEAMGLSFSVPPGEQQLLLLCVCVRACLPACSAAAAMFGHSNLQYSH